MHQFFGEPTVEVLSSGFAAHNRPFHMSERGGLPAYLFRLQTEGHAKVLVQGQWITVQAGDLFLGKPGDHYELAIAADHSGGMLQSLDYFLYCRGGWIDHWWQQAARPSVSHVPTEDGILPLWRQLILERRKSTTDVKGRLIDSLLRSLCLTIDRALAEMHEGAHSANAFVAQRMKSYVEQHAWMTFTVKDVADNVGLSVSRAVHLFKETFGQTLMEFALEVRLSTACELIRYGSMSLEQAALSSGFRSYSYFHRAFKARYGVSPRAYRTENG